MSADSVRIFIPKYGKALGKGFSRAEIFDSFAHPGRRTTAKGYTSPASWITELSDTRKAILLCSVCDRKFDSGHMKYRLRYTRDPSGVTDGSLCNGQCDACKQPSADLGGGKMWVPEELWEAVSIDPEQARINNRMAWRSARFDWVKRLLRR